MSGRRRSAHGGVSAKMKTSMRLCDGRRVSTGLKVLVIFASEVSEPTSPADIVGKFRTSL
jgi:hypothetical protein